MLRRSKAAKLIAGGEVPAGVGRVSGTRVKRQM
jgi:hypothetical protein